MAESVKSVSERRIRPIEEAAESGHWKQALKECEKWHKKGEKSDKFLSLRATVLAHQTDKSQRDRGHNEAMQLLRRTPALVDHDAIVHLVRAFDHLDLDQHVGELWERAISAGTNKELNMSFLDDNIEHGNWIRAQKATMALRKNYPKERQYEFWNILMCHLVHLQPTVEEKQRNLLGTLAYRMMEKAVEATPTDRGQVLSSGKSIATAEELYLLVDIYLKTGHASEAVDVLTSHAFTATSEIGMQDPQLRLGLLMSALEQSGEWDRAFTICQDLLQTPEYASDDRVWDLLLLSEVRCKSGRKAELARFLSDYTSSNRPHNRSAFSAALRFTTSQVQSGDEYSANLLPLCKVYFLQHQGNRYLFQDLVDHLSVLDEIDRNHFRTFLVETSATLKTSMAVLTFDYVMEPPPNDMVTLLYRARIAIEYYQAATKKSATSIQGPIMAALDLVRASIMSDRVDYTLRAVFLLEFCRSQNEDVFALTVLLIECYLKLGLVSMAMDSFAKLNIKNLQWENAGHLLLTRISSVHPHASGSVEETLNPLEALEAGLGGIIKADRSISEGIRKGLRHGSYSNIMNSVRTRTDIYSSLNRWLYQVELNKAMRLQNIPSSTFPPLPPHTIVDKRDYSFLPRFMGDDDRVHHYLACGPTPKKTYIRFMLFVEDVARLLRLDPVSDKEESQIAYQNTTIKPALDTFSGEDFRKDMTKMEMWLVGNVINLRRLVVWRMMQDTLPAPRKSLVPDVSKEIRMVEESFDLAAKWTSDLTHHWEEECRDRMVGGIRAPIWDYLHDSYCQLELCQITGLFLDWMKERRKSKRATTHEEGQEMGATKIDRVLRKEIGDHFSTKDSNDRGTSGTADSSTEFPSDKTNKAIIMDDERMQHWISLVERLHANIREGAHRVLEGLKEEGMTGKLTDVAFAHEPDAKDEAVREENKKWEDVLDKLCEKDKNAKNVLNKACERMKESWEDAVQGILKVEVWRKK